MYCAAPGFGGEDVLAASGVEAFGESVADFGEVLAETEDHGAAAEAGSGEARAERARVHGGIHQAIERGTAYMQAVAQAGVGGEEDLAEARGVAAGPWRPPHVARGRLR